MEKLYYREYYKLEREHWWFKARLNILEYFVENRLYDKNSLNILNAGAAKKKS